MKAQKRVEVQLYAFFNLGASWWWVMQCHALASLSSRIAWYILYLLDRASLIQIIQTTNQMQQ